MNAKEKIGILMLGVLLGSIIACNGSSTALSGVNTSDLRLIGHAGKAPTAAMVTHAAILPPGSNAGTPLAVTSVCSNLGVIVPGSNVSSGLALYQTCVGAYYEADMDSGDVLPAASEYFVSSDCTGTPLLTVPSSMPGLFARGGYVFTAPDGSAWQVAPNAAKGNATAGSIFTTSGGCSPTLLSGSFFVTAVSVDGSLGVAGPNVGGDQTLVAP